MTDSNAELDRILYALMEWDGVEVAPDSKVAREIKYAKAAINKLILEARKEELERINSINARIDDDFGELDAQEAIEKYVDDRIAEIDKELG